MRRRFNPVLTVPCLAALAFGASMAANADVWGYVDESGTARIAATRVDDRYQLFFRGGARVEAPGAATAEAQARAAFGRTPGLQRMLDHRNAERFEPLIEQHARLQQLDPALVKAVIAVESSFEPEAVSPKGAVGLMQIIPDTGERYGVAADARRSVAQKLRDPAINLRVGTRYLRDLLAMFADDIPLALAAYNAGENAVKRFDNSIPPFAETRDYVKLVQQFHSYYRPLPRASPKQVHIVIPGRRDPLVLPAAAAATP